MVLLEVMVTFCVNAESDRINPQNKRIFCM